MNEDKITKQIQILINQFNVKNFNHVISKARTLVKKNPGYVIIYNLLGSSYQNIGDFENAKETFIQGLKLDHKNIAIKNNLAMAYTNLLQYQLAEKLFLEILKENPKYINAYVNYGNLKRDINSFEDAIDLYKRALKLDDKNPVVFYSLALAYQGIGKFNEAINYANKVLNIENTFTQSDHLISQSKKYEINDKHYLDLKKKLKNKDLTDFNKIDLYFSLAKAEEDIGNIKETSEYLIKGNSLKNKILKYNISNEINLFKDIQTSFKKVNFENENNECPIIFILGMPRSGTSLVEQIITSHSNVFGGGELPILSKIIKDEFIKNNQLDFEKFNEIIDNPARVNNLKETYINFIKNFDFKEKFITDKAPLNFRWIGFIKKIFPNSKIIHCTRDPKNNCLSMYKNLFEGGLSFTYDQENLVNYYKNYNELMKFWKSIPNNNIHEVRYESLINKKNDEIKKLIEYCDLPWEENCLMFYKNKTPIKTMSTAQARRPIYKSSVDPFSKFKNYFDIIDKSL